MSESGVSRDLLGAAGVLSLGAGFIHASVIGAHADHRTLAMLFIAAAALQTGWAVAAFVRPSRGLALAGAVGNLGAFAFWLATRITAVGIIDGLEEVEKFAFIDTACGVLALVSAAVALLAVAKSDMRVRVLKPLPVGALAVALTLGATVSGVTSPHTHGEGHSHGTEEAAGHDHADASSEGSAHDHSGSGSDSTHAHEAADSNWPRPWDPTKPIDLSGVSGVSAKQESYGVELIQDTMRDLPTYANPKDAVAAGYRSINDAGTGVEHYINWAYTRDGKFLDSKYPESLVYEVEPGGGRKLVSAMYIAEPEYEVGSAKLNAVLGPLVTWHIHDNLCFSSGSNGTPVVAGLTDKDGNCPGKLFTLPTQPMIHVWIAPHKCGPFAALEGVGAGQASSEEAQNRVDSCTSEHHH